MMLIGILWFRNGLRIANERLLGAFLSVSVDTSTILPGELTLGPLASALHFHRKMFISRSALKHEVYPSISAFQFPAVESVVDSSTLTEPTPSLIPSVDVPPDPKVRRSVGARFFFE